MGIPRQPILADEIKGARIVDHVALIFMLINGQLIAVLVRVWHSRNKTRHASMMLPATARHAAHESASALSRSLSTSAAAATTSTESTAAAQTPLKKLVASSKSCAEQSLAYGRCVGARYMDVSKGMCQEEFMAFKQCVQVSRLRGQPEEIDK